MNELADSRALLKVLKPQTREMVACLRRLVECESPSLEKAAADRCCALLAEEWRGLGSVERVAQKQRGDHLRITWSPNRATAPAPYTGQIVVLGHYDTVYESGTLRRMPFRVRGGKAFGPGVFDMKGGIVQALFAVRALQQMKAAVGKRVVFLWTSDEEIGSGTSRKLLEGEALRSQAVFVLEPAFGPRGLLKTSRKGVGEAEIIAHGRASHAGLAPQDGVNAIHELAAQIRRVEKWNNAKRGITVNADVVEGGTRTNVIAERARAVLDLRALRGSDMHRIEKRLRGLLAVHRGARLEVRGGFDRPPLSRAVSAKLYARAKILAAKMGVSLGECCAGGGSDGNLTAALGVPTLDGMGAVGGGAHSCDEFVVVAKLAERAALLAQMLLNC